MVDEKVIEAFELMWGSFPEPVILVHKNRDILAVNEACSKMGGEVGSKCSARGTPEQHRGCLANQALATGQATYSRSDRSGRDIIGYWLPVRGYPDVYVHLGVGTMIDYAKASQ